jgi:hypothetical protein
MNYSLNCVILSATVVIRSDLTDINHFNVRSFVLHILVWFVGILIQSSSEVMSWMVARPVTLVQTGIPRNAM